LILAMYSTVNEGLPISVKFSLTRFSSLTSYFTLELTPDSALLGVNYKNVANNTVSFGPHQNSTTLTVPTLDDNIYDLGNTRTFNITIISIDGLISPANDFVLSVVDIDLPPTVIASTTTPVVREGDSVDIDFTLSHATYAMSQFSYTTQDGAAQSGVNYEPAAGTVLFSPMQLTSSITLKTRNDEIPNVGQSLNFFVQYTSTSFLLLATSDTTINVTDASGPPYITASVPQTNNEGDEYIIQFTLSYVSDTTVSFTYNTKDSTALDGINYIGKSGQVSFSAGMQTQTLSITTTRDNVYMGGETLSFTLSYSSPLNGLLTTTESILLITDIDNAPELNAIYSTVNEGSSIKVNFTLSRLSSLGCSFEFVLTPGTALPGVNYVDYNASISFAPFTTSSVITIQTKDDNVFDLGNTRNFEITVTDFEVLSPPSDFILSVVDTDTCKNIKSILKHLSYNYFFSANNDSSGKSNSGRCSHSCFFHIVTGMLQCIFF
jgi:hypothetical protein